jgi:hypothetical protein
MRAAIAQTDIMVARGLARTYAMCGLKAALPVGRVSVPAVCGWQPVTAAPLIHAGRSMASPLQNMKSPIPAHHREQLWLGRATEGAPIYLYSN